MNVCEKTRGWPSTDLEFGGGFLPCKTLPETVTSREGGCVPVHWYDEKGLSRMWRML